MSSIGTGYDLSSTTFSTDGRLFQIEYAGKAVDNSGTAVGICCKDGVVLGVEKLVVSKMLEKGSNKRLFAVDKHVGMAVGGLVADGRHLASRGRQEAASYISMMGTAVPSHILSDRLASYIHLYSMYWSVRPFGVAVLLAAQDSMPYGVNKTPNTLYMIEPSGAYYGYHACAIGKAKQAAKTELDKLKPSEMTCREAVKEIARIIYSVHDQVKDRDFELELGWVCEESKGIYQLVPESIKQEAEEHAKAALQQGDEEEEGDENMQ